MIDLSKFLSQDKILSDIYIYICVCVCVCVFGAPKFWGIQWPTFVSGIYNISLIVGVSHECVGVGDVMYS